MAQIYSSYKYPALFVWKRPYWGGCHWQ